MRITTILLSYEYEGIMIEEMNSLQLRQQIIETATTLLLEKGWDHVTVEDLLTQLGGLTEPEFQQHFTDMKQVTQAVTATLFAENVTCIDSANGGKTGLEKIKYLFIAAFQNVDKLRYTKDYTSSIQNAAFIGSKMIEGMNMVSPLLEHYLNEGNNDGSLCVEYPRQVAETLILLTNLWLSPFVFVVPKNEYELKIKYYKIMFNNIGLPLIDDEMEQMLMQYYCLVIGSNSDVQNKIADE